MIGDRLSRSALFLVSEFVVIVLGVLVALGVDEWREAQKQREVREQLIAGLIADLEAKNVAAIGIDSGGFRSEFTGLVRRAGELQVKAKQSSDSNIPG